MEFLRSTAHAYPVPRTKQDLYQDDGINYHYMPAEVDGNRVLISMNKLALKNGNAVWSKPDQVTL